MIEYIDKQEKKSFLATEVVCSSESNSDVTFCEDRSVCATQCAQVCLYRICVQRTRERIECFRVSNPEGGRNKLKIVQKV